MYSRESLQQQINSKIQELDKKTQERDSIKIEIEKLEKDISDFREKARKLNSEAKQAEREADELGNQIAASKRNKTRHGGMAHSAIEHRNVRAFAGHVESFGDSSLDIKEFNTKCESKRKEASLKKIESAQITNQYQNLTTQKIRLESKRTQLYHSETGLTQQIQKLERELRALPASRSPSSRFSSIDSVSTASLHPSVSPSWNLPNARSPR